MSLKTMDTEDGQRPCCSKSLSKNAFTFTYQPAPPLKTKGQRKCIHNGGFPNVQDVSITEVEMNPRPDPRTLLNECEDLTEAMLASSSPSGSDSSTETVVGRRERVGDIFSTPPPSNGPADWMPSSPENGTPPISRIPGTRMSSTISPIPFSRPPPFLGMDRLELQETSTSTWPMPESASFREFPCDPLASFQQTFSNANQYNGYERSSFQHEFPQSFPMAPPPPPPGPYMTPPHTSYFNSFNSNFTMPPPQHSSNGFYNSPTFLNLNKCMGMELVTFLETCVEHLYDETQEDPNLRACLLPLKTIQKEVANARDAYMIDMTENEHKNHFGAFCTMFNAEENDSAGEDDSVNSDSGSGTTGSGSQSASN